MKLIVLEPVYTQYIPPELEAGLLYVSMEYATASHLCVCGCGRRVVTPLGNADWTLKFDGTVTLNPSVGNGQFPCRSHYWIRRNEVVWAPRMSPAQVRAHQKRDAVARDDHYGAPVDDLGLMSWVRRWIRR